MLKLEAPFHLLETSDELHFRGGLAQDPSKAREIMLAGLLISLETRGEIYGVSSDGYAASDNPASSRSTIWPRSLLPLPFGVSVEQQMLLPAAGDAVAASWRLTGRSAFPVRLKVTPVFQPHERKAVGGFGFEPETNGGRLAWRPYFRHSKILADTNGCFGPRNPRRAFHCGIDCPQRPGLVPGTFEFALGPRPAILILAAESPADAAVNPLIGAFLAKVAEQRASMTLCPSLRNLAAA